MHGFGSDTGLENVYQVTGRCECVRGEALASRICVFIGN